MEFTDFTKYVAVSEIVLKQLKQVKFKLILFFFTELLLFAISITNTWKKLELTSREKKPIKPTTQKPASPNTV